MLHAPTKAVKESNGVDHGTNPDDEERGLDGDIVRV